MVKIRLNKIEAARRQLDAAIRMTFAGEDPVAIHTVAAAGHRIIRDICEKRGDIESYLRFTDWIAPGFEKQFWRLWNASTNFLKHADEDAAALHDLDEETADFLIVVTCKWYRDLGNTLSEEMRVFGGWYGLTHPQTIKAEALQAAGFGQTFALMADKMKLLSRRDQLVAGSKSLRNLDLRSRNWG